MTFLFKYARSFNQDLSSWNTSSVSGMNSMFYGVELFNADISSWDVSSVNDFSFMFAGASSFNQNLCQWKRTISQNAKVTDMFLDTSCPKDVEPTLEEAGFNPLCHSCL